MEMVQAYQGYFREDGRFISNGIPTKIPARRRAIVTLLEDEATETEPEQSREAQYKAFSEFFAAMKSLNERGIEPIDEEFDAILSDKESRGDIRKSAPPRKSY